MKKIPRETWTLTLDVPTTDAPAAILMRHVLKRIWRAWGIRCVAVGPEAGQTVTTEPDDASEAKPGPGD